MLKEICSSTNERKKGSVKRQSKTRRNRRQMCGEKSTSCSFSLRIYFICSHPTTRPSKKKWRSSGRRLWKQSTSSRSFATKLWNLSTLYSKFPASFASASMSHQADVLATTNFEIFLNLSSTLSGRWSIRSVRISGVISAGATALTISSIVLVEANGRLDKILSNGSSMSTEVARIGSS